MLDTPNVHTCNELINEVNYNYNEKCLSTFSWHQNKTKSKVIYDTNNYNKMKYDNQRVNLNLARGDKRLEIKLQQASKNFEDRREKIQFTVPGRDRIFVFLTKEHLPHTLFELANAPDSPF